MLTLNTENIGIAKERYKKGIDLLHQAYSDFTDVELDLVPIQNAWSPRYLLAHLVDFEPIIAARMKMIIATENPLLLGYDERPMAAKLFYSFRPMQLELDIFKLIRTEFLTIVTHLEEMSWKRVGVHNELGRITLWQYFQVCIGHLEHHLYHLDLKRKAMGKEIIGVGLSDDYPASKWLFRDNL